MDDIEEDVISLIQKDDSTQQLKDALGMLQETDPEERSESCNRLIAEVAYLLMLRAGERGEYDAAERYSNIASNYLLKVDTSTQKKNKPILASHISGSLTERQIEDDIPVKVTRE